LKRWTSSTSKAFRRLRPQQKGATAVLCVVLTGLFGTVGLTVDVARVFAAKSTFTAATQAASLAGARALLQIGATQTTVAAAVTTWNTANPPANVTITNTSTSLSCVRYRAC
jgi:Flp pilus assembly protein TadG